MTWEELSPTMNCKHCGEEIRVDPEAAPYWSSDYCHAEPGVERDADHEARPHLTRVA